LASHGYATLALAYFRLPGLPRGLVNIPLEYFGKAIARVRAPITPRNDFIAVHETSRGGELALLLASLYADIRAVVTVVPSGVVFGGLGPSEPGDLRPRGAWTLEGKPVPLERATIPVERIKGPVLMVSGRDDQLWPPLELAEIARLASCPTEEITPGMVMMLMDRKDFRTFSQNGEHFRHLRRGIEARRCRPVRSRVVNSR
jgi:fermentation-respiration switch protein FrsA (DUF1100 family)